MADSFLSGFAKMSGLAGEKKRIVILGGGFAGAYALKEVGHQKAFANCDVVLIDRNNYLLFYPLLVEAGVGSIEARHVVVPTRKFLKQGRFEMAEVTSIDLQNQIVIYEMAGEPHTLSYDHLVIGLGSVTREPNVEGLSKYGFTLKTLDDAIGLRDRGIRLLELANSVTDTATRRELLTVITVGANYTGVEFAGEFHAFLQEAARGYRNVKPSDIRMLLLEYGDSILSATTPKLAGWCARTLLARGLEIQTRTTLTELSLTSATSSTGETIPCRTVVWTAGIAANPLLAGVRGLPLNKSGYIECNSDLSVKGFNNVWAIGDAATVLDEVGKPFGATAQTASREGPVAMRNIAARLAGEETKPFSYRNLGAFAAIGHKQAAADVLGFQFTGFVGWMLYRATYLAKMPSLGMKIRLLADWMTELVFRNEPVQLGVHRYRGTEGERL